MWFVCWFCWSFFEQMVCLWVWLAWVGLAGWLVGWFIPRGFPAPFFPGGKNVDGPRLCFFFFFPSARLEKIQVS